MNRRAFLGTLGLLAAPLTAEAQPAVRVWRVGYLSVGAPELDQGWVTALRQGLRGLGYEDGKNLVFEQRHAAGDTRRLDELAAELVHLKTDLFVVYGAGLTVPAIRKADPTASIVMASADPVGEGLIESLARPGGNVTGLADAHADLAPKRLELLKEIVPRASRVAVLWNPGSRTARQVQSIEVAAAALGLTIVRWPARRAQDVAQAFAGMQRQRPDVLLLVPEPAVVRFDDPQIPALALKNRLPAIGTIRQFASAGLLMSYGTDFAELWRRAAIYVDKILKGAKPAELPVEQPTKFELVINLKTAKALGLTIPASLLQRADQVIE